MLTPARRIERENEDLRALPGLFLVCLLYAIGSATYTYLTTGGF